MSQVLALRGQKDTMLLQFKETKRNLVLKGSLLPTAEGITSCWETEIFGPKGCIVKEYQSSLFCAPRYNLTAFKMQ